MAAAVAALAAQEHARQVQEVIAAFRRARATAPASARSLADVGVADAAAAAASLAAAGVLVAGPAAETWYLDEIAAEARREAEARAASRRPAAYVVGALMGIVVAAAIVWAVYRG